MTEAGFDPEIPEAIDRADGVRVGTRRDASSPGPGANIWAVVVDGASVRSVRGGKGRRYREASANPEVTLRVNAERTVEGVSEAARDKYGASCPGPTVAMLREGVLATTLRLLPA